MGRKEFKGVQRSLKERPRVTNLELNELLNDLFLFQRLLLIWPVLNRILLILIAPCTELQAQT